MSRGGCGPTSTNEALPHAFPPNLSFPLSSNTSDNKLNPVKVICVNSNTQSYLVSAFLNIVSWGLEVLCFKTLSTLYSILFLKFQN